jgi:hypothetical protein
MNRAERIARATEIYQQEQAKYEDRLSLYKEAYAKWETEAKPLLEENEKRRTTYMKTLDVPPCPNRPRQSDAEREALLRIMDELSLSKDMTREYIAVIKHRIKQ